MFRMTGTGLVALVVLAVPTTGRSQAPAAPAGAPGVAAPGGVQAIPGANDVLATVTSHGQTDKITKADVVNLLSRVPLPPADERESAYTQAVDYLATIRLLKHYLAAQRIQILDAKIDEQIEALKQRLSKGGQDLATALLQSGSSMDEVRGEIASNLRFDTFVQSRATEAALKKYLNENRDRFSGTQVRASHILIKLEPNAAKEQKEKARQKLEAIRKEIVGGKMTFAAAANKYSEDPANASGAGGDVDYFRLDGEFVEEFAEAAFKLKKGEVSGPVETPFGMHLIQVTDRKEGKLPDFDQNKPYIFNAFRAQLQKDIVTEERKTGKIEIKPMPKDLFPPEPPAGAAAPAAAPAPGAAVPKS